MIIFRYLKTSIFCSVPSFKAGRRKIHLSSYVGATELKERYRDIKSRTRILGGFKFRSRFDVSSLSLMLKLLSEL